MKNVLLKLSLHFISLTSCKEIIEFEGWEKQKDSDFSKKNWLVLEKVLFLLDLPLKDPLIAVSRVCCGKGSFWSFNQIVSSKNFPLLAPEKRPQGYFKFMTKKLKYDLWMCSEKILPDYGELFSPQFQENLNKKEKPAWLHDGMCQYLFSQYWPPLYEKGAKHGQNCNKILDFDFWSTYLWIVNSIKILFTHFLIFS